MEPQRVSSSERRCPACVRPDEAWQSKMRSRREARMMTTVTSVGEDLVERDDRATGVGWVRTY
jgi:hypothetical protein